MDPDIAELLGIDIEDPDVRREAAAVERDMNLIETLVKLRQQRGLTQKQVAERMGRSQPTVSDFERVGGDPHLSTIRRYALAVGADVRHGVLVWSDPAAGWNSTAHIPSTAQVEDDDPGDWNVGQLPLSFEVA
jgi:transcriptional regulator with XRE-family HTH domain